MADPDEEGTEESLHGRLVANRSARELWVAAGAAFVGGVAVFLVTSYMRVSTENQFYKNSLSIVLDTHVRAGQAQQAAFRATEAARKAEAELDRLRNSAGTVNDLLAVGEAVQAKVKAVTGDIVQKVVERQVDDLQRPPVCSFVPSPSPGNCPEGTTYLGSVGRGDGLTCVGKRGSGDARYCNLCCDPPS